MVIFRRVVGAVGWRGGGAWISRCDSAFKLFRNFIVVGAPIESVGVVEGAAVDLGNFDISSVVE